MLKKSLRFVHNLNIKVMEIHKGEEVRKVIVKMGFKINAVAAAIEMNRGSLASRFKDPDMDRPTIEKIGEFIGYDFSKIFGDYVSPPMNNLVMEPHEMNYGKEESTMISVALDGSERTFDQVIQKLKVINQGLRKWNEIKLNTDS